MPADDASYRGPRGHVPRSVRRDLEQDGLAARKNMTPLDVPLEDIRKLLREHGAIVPGA